MARIAFFGTPEFSLPCLDKLFKYCKQHHHQLVMVVTQKDMPKGRGKKLTPPPVKILANTLGIKVFQPETLKKGSQSGDEFFDSLKESKIDLAIVVAYGKLIPERILKLPTYGFLNIHASLLPRFRGAAPAQRAIEAGDEFAGVCLMDMVKKLDEGDVFAQEKTKIIPFDTSATLLRRLSTIGGKLLIEKLNQLLSNSLVKVPQPQDGVLYAHMLNKEEGMMDFFTQPAHVIKQKVQAYDPWPGAYGFINGMRVKFFDAFFIKTNLPMTSDAVGSVVVANKFLGVKTFDGVVYFQSIQIAGKKIMPVQEAIKGFAINVGQMIEQQ